MTLVDALLSWAQTIPPTLSPAEFHDYVSRTLREFNVEEKRGSLTSVLEEYYLDPQHPDHFSELQDEIQYYTIPCLLHTQTVAEARQALSAEHQPLLRYKSTRSDAIQHTLMDEYAGSCDWLDTYHDMTLFYSPESFYGQTSPLIVDGLFVGTVKRVGDNSLLALRNVVDKEGRLALAFGVVYEPPLEIQREAEKEERPFAPLHVDKLDVQAIRILKPENAPFADYLRKLARKRDALERRLTTQRPERERSYTAARVQRI